MIKLECTPKTITTSRRNRNVNSLHCIDSRGFQPLTIITKSSTLDVEAVLDPSLDSSQSISGLCF